MGFLIAIIAALAGLKVLHEQTTVLDKVSPKSAGPTPAKKTSITPKREPRERAIIGPRTLAPVDPNILPRFEKIGEKYENRNATTNTAGDAAFNLAVKKDPLTAPVISVAESPVVQSALIGAADAIDSWTGGTGKKLTPAEVGYIETGGGYKGPPVDDSGNPSSGMIQAQQYALAQVEHLDPASSKSLVFIDPATGRATYKDAADIEATVKSGAQESRETHNIDNIDDYIG